MCELHRVDWSALTSDTILQYNSWSNQLLSNTVLPSCVVHFDSSNSDNFVHLKSIAELYNDIIQALKASYDLVILQKNCVNFTPIPGWTVYLKESYDESRMAFYEWKFHGRPHQGPVYERMKLTRFRFKYAQRRVEGNQDTLRAECLASKLDTCVVKTFWKEVKFINTGSTPLSNMVGETFGGKTIAGM